MSGHLAVALGLTLAGWFAAAWRMRRRLALLADAEHELRGPLTALGLLADGLRRDGEDDLAAAIEVQVGRARAALDDLSGPSGAVTWAAGGDQVYRALGNLVQNAVQHGDGDVVLRAERSSDRLRLVVENETPSTAGRRRGGRGLRIARQAAERAGGELVVSQQRGTRSSVLELPGPGSRSG